MKKIARVAIIGAGDLGRRIALGCALQGKKARLYDILPSALDQAITSAREAIEQRIRDGRLRSDIWDLAIRSLSISPSLAACLSGVDLVIETVPERLDLKHEVIAAIDSLADPDTIIVSSSSLILPSLLAAATQRPEKIINLNFGAPDTLKVEVMAHAGTAADTRKSVVAFVRSLALVPIVLRHEISGYATNRVWQAIEKEVLHLLDGGCVGVEDIDRGWMLDYHTSIGPCGMMDKTGLDVVCAVRNFSYQMTRDPSDLPPPFFVDLVRRGMFGEKSGGGFYQYPNPSYSQPEWLTAPIRSSYNLHAFPELHDSSRRSV
ncbi:MAG: 3-hydroxyacyl-CoA dehydrogenase family protein [Candidatus Acidiferrales bacterium]